jgi:NAD(P)H-dependent FMN reductase
MNSECPIKLVAIAGSVRPGNFTSKALALAVDEARKEDDVSVELLDPAELDLALPGRKGGEAAAREIQEAVKGATGVILATPEYHGSFSSVMKLVIDNLGFPSALAGKPVALLGVAAGRIGAIKSLEHLRSVASHVGAVVLPGPVSVAGVQQLFDAEGRINGEGTETQIRGVATRLIEYIRDHICPKATLEAMVRE